MALSISTAASYIHAVRIAIKEIQQNSFPATEVMLFTTKHSGSTASLWLIADSKDMGALKKTTVSHEIKRRYLAREFKPHPATRVRRHFANVSEEDEVIHILVWLPAHLRASQSRKRSPESLDALTPPSTRPRPSPLTSPLTQECMQQLQADVLRSLALTAIVVHWVPAANEYPELLLLDAGCFLTIPLRYFAHSGVRTPVSDQDAMLDIRKAVAQEWHAIQEWTIDLPSRLWIVGAPGAGKSCAAFAFACSIARAKWNVLWMRYEPRQNKVSCVKFVGNEKATFEFHGIDAARAINGLIAPWLPVPSTPLIVFFDGYKKTVSCQIIEQVLLAYQSGYDAVVKEEVHKSTHVTFLPMTRSKQHSFKAKAFDELLQKLCLSRPLTQVVRVDLYFVVPSDVVKDFKAPVSHADFWREVVEVADPIRATGIKCTIEVVGVRYPNFNDVSFLY